MVEVEFASEYFKDMYQNPENPFFYTSRIKFNLVDQRITMTGYAPIFATNLNYIYSVAAWADVKVYYPSGQVGEGENGVPSGIHFGGVLADVSVPPKMKCPGVLFGASCKGDEDFMGMVLDSDFYKKWQSQKLMEISVTYR